MVIWLQALAEAWLAAVAVGGVLVFCYNRYLSGLRESYVKKSASLLVLPLAALAGVGHGAAVVMGWPRLIMPLALGGGLMLWVMQERWREQRLNQSVQRRRLVLPGGDGIAWGRYHPVVRVMLGLLSPWNRAGRPEWVTLEVAVPDLHPDMEGYRLVFLTDFHVHPTLTNRYYREVVDAALAARPDAILVGGDFVSRRWNIARSRAVLARLGEHPNVVVVRGNHDFWTRPAVHARTVTSWGGRLLSNQVLMLRRGNGRVALVGLEHPYIPLTARARGGLAAQLDAADLADGRAPRFGLVHTPETYAQAAALGCRFAVAGHTHGGQIRLPLFGTTIASTTVARQFTWGRGQWDAMETFTSNGIGCFFPLRIDCPPQVVEIRLVRPPAA